MKENEKKDDSQLDRVLVTDMDGCAMSISSKRSDLLSPAQINYVKEQKYTAFYGATNRTTLSAAWVNCSRYWRTWYVKYSPNELKNIFTSKIIGNFETATGLPCWGVSMLDDVISKKLGSTYEVIKQYEESGRADWGSVCARLHLVKHLSSKNLRLLQVAQDLAKHYGDKKVILDFMDDSRGLCDEAAKADQQLGWPKKVKLNVFQHRADEGDNAKIIPIYLYDKGYVGSKEPVSLGKRFGLFAMAATVAAAAAAVVYSDSRECFLVK